MTSPVSGRMPEWPESPLDGESLANFAIRNSHYWEARCRLAVAALDRIEYTTNDDTTYKDAHSVIKAIGPLPGDNNGQ